MILQLSKSSIYSTKPISKDDAVLLTEASYNPRSESGRNWIHANEYGYIIRITCDNQEWKQHLRDDGISWPTIENIEKVLNAGFECVHFDRDADIVDELIAWDW
ncbi:TPA: hypothetical protein L9Y30_004751 [Klebsiella pneumoniae]|nr:hypothetical protein [Klebsiella pneumoniae]